MPSADAPQERQPQQDDVWPACAIPELPPARGFESSATAELRPRYEDITQDGRIQLTALTPGLGAVWRNLYRTDKLEAFRNEGILPILHRMVIRGEKGPFTVNAPIQVSGTWRIARETDGDRIFLDMWLEVHAPIGTTLGQTPSRDAERVLAGRIYAGHVLTKPFAPPGERKVTRIQGADMPEIPEDTHPLDSAMDLVAGHVLEPVGEHVFGMMHTDSNQHVNSLVYPRVFEEAVVRRLDESRSGLLLSRAVDMRWRKPFFGGQHAALALCIGSPSPDTRAAVGVFRPVVNAEGGGGGEAKPSCAIAMWLS